MLVKGEVRKHVWNSSFSEHISQLNCSKNHRDKQHHLHCEDVNSHPKCQRILNCRVSLEVQTKTSHYTPPHSRLPRDRDWSLNIFMITLEEGNEFIFPVDSCSTKCEGCH